MRVWTIQPVSLFETLQQQKVLHSDFNQSQYHDYDDFIQAYAWLADQMTKLIGPAPAGVKVPFWAWHTVDWKHRKVDLRTTLFRIYPDPMVCLELEVDDEQVLLSDFENWHFVLNNWYRKLQEQVSHPMARHREMNCYL